MKKLLGKTGYYLLISALILLSFTTIRDRVNFSGDWKLNESKSELGDFSGFVPRSLKVDQKENVITITRTTPGFNGGDPVTSTLTLSYDGKITESEGFGGSKRKTTSKWSDDGAALIVDNTIKFDMDGQTNEFKSTETWTIKDGTLSIVTHSNSPRGETTTKAIYTH